MAENYANFVATNLDGAISDSDTSMNVASAAGLPEANFRLVIQDTASDDTNREIVLVTAKAGTTFDISRAQEGTSAVAHADGSFIAHVLTAAALRQIVDDAIIVPSFIYPEWGGIPTALTTWSVANRAELLRCVIPKTLTLTGIGLRIQGTISGRSIDVGVYDLNGNRLASSGSVSLTATGRIRFAFTSPLELSPGRYFLAVVIDGTSVSVEKVGANQYLPDGAHGWALSAFPLPSSVSILTAGQSGINSPPQAYGVISGISP